MGFAILAASVLGTAAAVYVFHPFPHDRRTDLLVYAFIGALGAIASGLSVLVDAMTGWELATYAPVLLAIAIPIAASINHARLRQVAFMTRNVLDPVVRSGAVANLKAFLEKQKNPNVADQHARRAAWVIAQAGLYEEAASILEDIDARKLATSFRAVHANDLCAYRLRSGDVAGAREALALAQRPAAAYEQILTTKDALLYSLEGQPDAALAIVARFETKRLPATHAITLALARAHAHAARADEPRAREALLDAARLVPDGWIDRATKPHGPASALATAMAAEKTAPYR
jgi:hypothetical protein